MSILLHDLTVWISWLTERYHAGKLWLLSQYLPKATSVNAAAISQRGYHFELPVRKHLNLRVQWSNKDMAYESI